MVTRAWPASRPMQAQAEISQTLIALRAVQGPRRILTATYIIVVGIVEKRLLWTRSLRTWWQDEAQPPGHGLCSSFSRLAACGPCYITMPTASLSAGHSSFA